jgi:Sec-independent protein translocase protein TatA
VNINLSEILLVLIVALVVIKPEQLPSVAFKLGRWSKQVRSGMNKLRRELDGTVSQLNEEVSPKALPEKADIQHEARKS